MTQTEPNYDNEDNNSMSVEVDTVHSQEENLGFERSILNTVVNRFKTQIVLVQEQLNIIENILNYK